MTAEKIKTKFSWSDRESEDTIIPCEWCKAADEWACCDDGATSSACNYCDYNIILYCLSHEDVTPVVHGKWIAGKEIAREMIGEQLLDIYYENYKCSACGLIIDRLLYCIDGSLFYKYCPNCGARMDGVK